VWTATVHRALIYDAGVVSNEHGWRQKKIL